MSKPIVDLSPKERRGLICRSELLSGASDAALDALGQAAELREIELGEVVVRQGAESDALFLLVLGEAEVRLEGGAGDAGLKLGELGTGQMVGELGLLTGEPRTATVRAISPVVALRIPRQVVLDVLTAHPELAAQVWTTVARRRMETLLAGSRRYADQADSARSWLVHALTPLHLPAGETRRLTATGTLFVVAGTVEADTELGWTCVRGPTLVPCVGPVECWARTDAVVAIGPPLGGLQG